MSDKLAKSGENLVSHTYGVNLEARNRLSGHQSFLMFFTGLSGSGKSTIANALELKLYQEQIRTYVLDGDNIRQGINRDLSFAPEDRSENLRRIGEIAKLFIDAGQVVLAAFIAPYENDRQLIKSIVGSTNYIEIFVNTPLEICEQRDVKGLYAKARALEITNMTGVSAPYEIPSNPDITIEHETSITEAVAIIYSFIKSKLARVQ